MQLALVSLIVIIVDQLSKYLTVKYMTEGASIPIIPGVFHLTFIYNRGAAFGLLENQQWIFILVALALIAVVFYFRQDIKEADEYTRFGTALLLGGAIGNLIDRIRINMVIDYFDFIIWPIFNIADVAICVGVSMIIWGTWKNSQS